MKFPLNLLLSLCALTLLGTGCARRNLTLRPETAPERTIAPGGGPAFVTDRSATPAIPSAPQAGEASADTRPQAESAPVRNRAKREREVEKTAVEETITPIRFTASQSEHVRLSDYDPFGEGDELTISLAELGRNFCYPYPGNRISDYGMRGRSMHTGVDIKATPNDTIRAALSGVVRMSKTYSSYGNTVVIRHPCGLETVYTHNAKNLVKVNDIVRAGDPIALAGRTGRATTEHLHFEVRVMGEHFDPNLLLNTEARTIQPGTLRLRRQNGRITASNSALPSKISETVQAVAPREAPQASPQRAATAEVPVVHTVQRGDTLYAIARKYGLTVEQLCQLNGIAREGILSLGQQLKLK
ncbi:MAG: peptidoglycan DD-metalloendopeptidase family protein [Rikenellaceae bacterium]|jgi:murein DD-endopeptidase MepM/ murein hydrolase activator NlpD|nr:peptidoglycan DD-metalloendopeptidase family protein [Rikenellaceae bacterium]